MDLGIAGLSDYKEIGSGGFATVYSAFEADAGRRVAVKILAAVDERGRRRFDRERRTMGQTTAHDNIVTMFRSGYTDSGARPYLVMEHMSGGSLQDLLEARGPLPISEAVQLIIAVARGLGFAHSTGIIHKDIKPANILISATGVPKLSDFGIAAVREATGTSQVAFSLAYTAPETFDTVQNANGEVVDPRDERSDLYSLAITLYALSTGTIPYTASNQAALIHQILTEPPQPTGQLALDAFFAVALAKDPGDRYPTTTQFIEALTRATEPTQLGRGQTTALALPPVGTELPRPKSSSERTTVAKLPNGPTPLDIERRTPSKRVADPPKYRPRWTPRKRLLALVTALAVLVGTWIVVNYDPANTIATYRGHGEEVTSVIQLANGDVASASADSTVQVWNPNNPEQTIASYAKHSDMVLAAIQLADGSIASAGADTTIQIWNPANPDATIATYTKHTNWVYSLVQLGNGNIASASGDGTVQIWNPANPEVTIGTYTGHTFSVTKVIQLDGGNIASAGADGTVQIWNPANPGDTIATYASSGGSDVTSLVQLNNGNVASADRDGTVEIWSPANPEIDISTYTGHNSAVTSVIQLTNGDIASGADEVKVWNPSDPGTTVASYRGHGNRVGTRVNSMIQLDNGTIASADNNGDIRIWDPSQN